MLNAGKMVHPKRFELCLTFIARSGDFLLDMAASACESRLRILCAHLQFSMDPSQAASSRISFVARPVSPGKPTPVPVVRPGR